MNKLWILLIAMAFFACQPETPQNYTLKGEITGAADGTVYLQDRVHGLMVPVDSTQMENGSFEFTGSFPEPLLYYLNIEGVTSRLAMFLENSDMELSMDATTPSQFELKGSQSHDILSEFQKRLEAHDGQLRDAEATLKSLEESGNQQAMEEQQYAIEELQQQRREAIIAYVSEYPDQPVSAYIVMRNLTHGADHNELDAIVAVLDNTLEGTRYYDDLQQRVKDLERVAIGMPAIDFTLPDTEGTEISLSDYRGQYVLISFWASWCPYCRVVNPDLVAAYENLKSDQFEILGVSLDRTREAWLKGIEDDGITWPQVSDLQGWQSGPAGEYVVRSIPQNVLIDPEGIIVKKNIKYDEVEIVIAPLL